MFRFLTAWSQRFDGVYRNRTFFAGKKARLLAFCDLVALGFVPLNIAKLLWLQPPEIFFRLGFNLILMAAAGISLYCVCRGRDRLAGAVIVGMTVGPIYLLLLAAPGFAEPLAVAVQLFAFDLVAVLVALIVASRRMAVGVLVVSVIGYLAFFLFVVRAHPAGSMEFTAGILLRDGLITLSLVFLLGIALENLIAGAHRRSEAALRETRAMNENLERLVAERTRELEAATQRANDASRAKGDFLANMSHEIRTPLNGIIASSELLRGCSGLSEEAAEHARLIADSGELLLKLIGDVLDLSKIEAGQLELENRPFALLPLVEDCLSLMATVANPAGVRLEFVAATGLARWFEGDGFRLRQVLFNLTSNAIKFTPAGGRVQLAVRSAGTNQVRFEVRDTGIGMDAVARGRLFQRYRQADASTSRRYGGTGLGLAISFRIVELMGGQMEVESAPGEGSTFHFTIPLPAAPDAEMPRTVAVGEKVHLGCSVLVADDNAINLRLVAAQLEKLGCRCATVSDGSEVLLALDRDPLPDVILMDCDMPRLNGWDATRQIRAWAEMADATPRQKEASRLPIVALTAATLPEERARCYAAGMTDYLAKPLKLANLQRVIASACVSVEKIPPAGNIMPVEGAVSAGSQESPSSLVAPGHGASARTQR